MSTACWILPEPAATERVELGKNTKNRHRRAARHITLHCITGATREKPQALLKEEAGRRAVSPKHLHQFGTCMASPARGLHPMRATLPIASHQH